MAERKTQKTSKATKNFFINIVALLPFLLLLASGIIILRYHGGMDYTNQTWNIDGHNWLEIHRILALIVIPFVGLHLWMHVHWLKTLFNFKKKSKGKNNDLNVALLVVFVLAVSTALLSWLVFKGTPTADLLREIHNKLGLALIFFFMVHLFNYIKWLVTMTKKSFRKKEK